MIRSLVLVVLALSSCAPDEPMESPTDAGPVEADAGLPDGGAGPDFSELTAFFDSVEQRRLINGYAIQVFDRQERLVFQRSWGRCVTPGTCPPGQPAFHPRTPHRRRLLDEVGHLDRGARRHR
jgi:hypothetical protein